MVAVRLVNTAVSAHASHARLVEPIEETSMAQAPGRPNPHARERRSGCRIRRRVGRIPRCQLPVGTADHAGTRAWRSIACAIQRVTEVLPLVPVTPITASDQRKGAVEFRRQRPGQ